KRRQLAALGLGLEDAPEVKLVRRYLKDAYRGLDLATQKFEDARAGRLTAAPAETSPAAEEPTSSAVPPEPEPPSDPEPAAATRPVASSAAARHPPTRAG